MVLVVELSPFSSVRTTTFTGSSTPSMKTTMTPRDQASRMRRAIQCMDPTSVIASRIDPEALRFYRRFAQQMEPAMNTYITSMINLAQSTLSGRLRTHREDARRIGLFTWACQVKAIQIVESDPAQLGIFLTESGQLVGDWANRSIDVAKNPLRFLFTDPFRDLRERTRKFAAEYDLDQRFRSALG